MRMYLLLGLVGRRSPLLHRYFRIPVAATTTRGQTKSHSFDALLRVSCPHEASTCWTSMSLNLEATLLPLRIRVQLGEARPSRQSRRGQSDSGPVQTQRFHWQTRQKWLDRFISVSLTMGCRSACTATQNAHR